MSSRRSTHVRAEPDSGPAIPTDTVAAGRRGPGGHLRAVRSVRAAPSRTRAVSAMMEAMTLPAGAILAVKSLAGAKSRLTGWDDERRRALVTAMLADTIAAIHAAGCTRVLVISPDPAVLEEAAACGAAGVREDGDGPGGLNRAMADGIAAARRRWPEVRRVALVQADLPAATGTQLRAALAAAAPYRQAFVADRRGDGTALLVRDADLATPTRFGPDSAALHRRDGLTELDPAHTLWAGLRNDVDTADDLDAALELGVGERTAAVVGDLPGDHSAADAGQSSPTARRPARGCVMIDR
ncbi:2-phospho-L-lactate guanylyltransferase [Gordonia amarae]|nr:2-phospho-L-lactate guanylyltransferase [Gordonia amarae]QHN22731.1 2-phospho-L-lactate guanylyltransferase [Gordonia amarae]QHN31634.1 2-phospho-L-lactate guanylyltransferase [Gordonia amarae]QHN40378.1 2-phospho-L-lactate guanylyltransferase [Gordonia amarae]